METRQHKKQSQTPEIPASQTRDLSKHPRSKSEAAAFVASSRSQAEREREIQNLARDQKLLEKALTGALDENRRLHREAKRRRSLERQYEDEKDLTAMLTIITEAVRESNKQMASEKE